MREHDCGCLPVVSSEGGRTPLGMITDRDICMAAPDKNKALSELLARDAMSRDVRACKPSDDHKVAERIMREARVRRVPVVDGDSLHGIVSLAQIARASADDLAGDIRDADVGNTLSAIRAPTDEARVMSTRA